VQESFKIDPKDYDEYILFIKEQCNKVPAGKTYLEHFLKYKKQKSLEEFK